MNICTNPIEMPGDKIVIYLYHDIAPRVVNIATSGSMLHFAEFFATPLGVSVQEVHHSYEVKNTTPPEQEVIKGTSLEFELNPKNSGAAYRAAHTTHNALMVVGAAIQKENAGRELDYNSIWDKIDKLRFESQDNL